MEDRNTGIALVDGKLDHVLQRIGVLGRDHIGAVGHDIGHVDVVKIEDVIDHLLLLVFNDALFSADIHHHADLFLGHALLVGVRIKTEQPHNKVCCAGKHFHKRRKELFAHKQNTDHGKRDLFALLHRHAFWRKLAEHKGEERDDDRDQHDGNRVDHRFRNLRTETDKPVRQQHSKVRRRGSGRQKAGQCHADLDRGQKIAGVFRQLLDLSGLLVALFRHLVDHVVVQRDDGDLAHGEKGVDDDEYKQKNQLKNQTSGVIHRGFSAPFCRKEN